MRIIEKIRLQHGEVARKLMLWAKGGWHFVLLSGAVVLVVGTLLLVFVAEAMAVVAALWCGVGGSKGFVGSTTVRRITDDLQSLGWGLYWSIQVSKRIYNGLHSSTRVDNGQDGGQGSAVVCRHLQGGARAR